MPVSSSNDSDSSNAERRGIRGIPVWKRTLWLISSVTLLAVCSPQAPAHHVGARDGRIDLRDFDFNAAAAQLRGEWRFVRNRLLAPEEFAAQRLAELRFAPDRWPHDFSAGAAYTGVATYQLEVELPPGEDMWAIEVNDLNTAARVFVDSRELLSIGTPGVDANSARPRILPQVRTFAARREAITLTVQISNFHNKHAGFFAPIRIGRPDLVQREFALISFVEILTAGGVLALGMHHALLFLRWRNNRAAWYIGLLALALGLRTLVTGHRTLLRLFPELPWSLTFRAEYLCFFAATALFVAFIAAAYDGYGWPALHRVFYFLAAPFSLAGLLADTLSLSHLLAPYYAVTGAAAAYSLTVLFRAWQAREEGALLSLTGLVPLIAFAARDAFVAEGALPPPYLSAVGFVLFVSVQTLVISNRTSRAYEKLERLSSRVMRMHAAQRRNDRLLAEASLKNLERRTNHHFVFNALNAIHGLLLSNPGRADELVLRISAAYRYMNEAGGRALVSFKDEWHLAETYLALQSIRYEGLFEFEVDVRRAPMDAALPPLSLQPLLENCFKHGFGARTAGSYFRVSVRVRAYRDGLVVRIRDNGREPAQSTNQGPTLTNIADRLNFHYRRVRLGVSPQASDGAMCRLIAFERRAGDASQGSPARPAAVVLLDEFGAS